MKQLITILSVFLIFSCNNSELNEEAKKAQEKNEAVFKTISKEWNFKFPNSRPEIKTTLDNWNDWRQFQNELEQKPKTSLTAFQLKIKNVAGRADSLHLKVPEKFNNPQVRSRLLTLDTQLNSLETYLNLRLIPEKKVISLIKAVNEEIAGVYIQMEEVIIKEAIPMEIGEAEMIRALDTSRNANSNKMEEAMKKEEDSSKALFERKNKRRLIK